MHVADIEAINLEQAAATRPAEAMHSQVFAITVMIPTLVGVARGLATMR